jgi:hypothetical protein
MPTFKADPFRIRVKHPDKTFGDLLSEIFALPADWNGSKSRWLIHKNSKIAIDKLQAGTPIIGAALRARLTDLEKRVGRAGIADLDVESDGGLGKHVAFLWDAKREQLWFQRDARALSINAFMDYVMILTDVAIDFRPVFHLDGVAKVMKMETIKSIEITLRDSIDGSSELEKSARVFELTELRRRYGHGARITVKITPPPRDYLGIEARRLARETAKLVESGAAEVKSAKVRGMLRKEDGDEEDSNLINLLKDRVQFSEEIPDEKFRQPEPLMKAIRKVWGLHHSEVPDGDE